MASKSIKKSKTTKHVKSFQSILTQHVPIKTILYLIIIVFVAVAFYAFQTNKNMSNTSKAAPMQTWVNPFQFNHNISPTITGNQNQNQTTCRAQCMQEANQCKAECNRSMTECKAMAKEYYEESIKACGGWQSLGYASKSACISDAKKTYGNDYGGACSRHLKNKGPCIDSCNKIQKDCNNRCK